jgi:uncharacterized protein
MLPGMKKTIFFSLAKTIFFALVLVFWGVAAPHAQVAATASQANEAAPAKVPVKTWLIHIIPPRPTFDKDATPAEDALMEQHFVYWKGLNEKGVCLFGGPVLDPRGVYGVIVVRATSEDDARALGEADPSVKAGVNKIDVAEMRVVFVPVTHAP